MTFFLPLVLSIPPRVALTGFVDDGSTKTHVYSPPPFRLVRKGGFLTTTIPVGSERFAVRIAHVAGGAKLAVDLNRDGVIQPNENVGWNRQQGTTPDGSTVTRYQGEVSLPLGGGRTARYGVLYFESNTRDPQFARLRDALVAVPEFGFLGNASFGGKSYRIGVRGGDLAHSGLFVDRDGDGVLGTVPAELFAMDRPFNLGGRSYRVTSFDPLGHPSIAFAPSAQRVAEIPMPPDLRVGKVAPSLVSHTLAGKPLAFPSAFRGKVVMLDVWATWCGPCRAEIPFMKDAYARFKGRGFEIASFSIDDPGKQPEVRRFTQSVGETWTQAFEGKGWQSPICGAYMIRAIPFFLLVDGNTGRILATGDDLRGPNMAPTIARALASRRR